jgi:DNA-binding NtrC family response regulator
MHMPQKLDSADRRFLSLVSRAAFLNPFGDERDRVDAEIAETAPGDPAVLARLMAKVASRLEALEVRGRLDLSGWSAPERDLVEHAVLFDAFHRFADPMDELIAAQLESGSEPVPVDFARDLLGLLHRRGIDAARAHRMLTLFYQMRRAFYFVAHGLVGRSASMRRLRESCWNAVFTHDIRLYDRHLWDRMEDFSTILLGETGTGKGAAAAAIGRSGFIAFDPARGRFEASFVDTLVPINLSQFPESLIESELFGHKKGAFTGAVEAHEGVFARCRPHGAIFLDEIGEVDVPVQIKLLRVLQERVFSPVGSREERRFEGRVIAATHRPLDDLRREGRFRDDFYYRLCSEVVDVPPLRRRLAEDPAELDDLLTSLIPRLVGEDARELTSVVREAIDRDLGPGYGWPGNVRELEQCIRRVLLTQRCVPDTLSRVSDDDAFLSAIHSGTLTADELVARYCEMLYVRHGTYVEVARVTGLDRRTVRKYVAAD